MRRPPKARTHTTAVTLIKLRTNRMMEKPRNPSATEKTRVNVRQEHWCRRKKALLRSLKQQNLLK
jgi:hypothetical protein